MRTQRTDYGNDDMHLYLRFLLYTATSLPVVFNSSYPEFVTYHSSLLTTAIFLLRPKPLDVLEARRAVKLWEFGSIADILLSRATEMENEDVGHLYLVDKFLPPTAFLRMLDALPELQKSHMMELALDKKTYELNAIMEGILSALPTQDREDSRRFMELLNALSCWSDVLYEASAPLFPLNIDLNSSGKVMDKSRRNRVPLSSSLIAKLESKNVKI